MRDHTAGHISTSIGKSPVELERFQQHGEAETSYPSLVTEQFEFVWTKRPTLGEFGRDATPASWASEVYAIN
jgi:hypothetical protein